VNLALDLEGGHHAGPLFVVQKARALARPKGQQGTVRRRQERRRTPKWADARAIRALFAEARRRTLLTGIPHVVDHVVPLIGKYNGVVIVSGLHWEGNMEVVTRRENSAKLNFWWPDAPFEQLSLHLV